MSAVPEDFVSLVRSITEAQVAAETRAALAEDKLVAAQSAYTEATLSVRPLEVQKQRLEREKAELQRTLEMQRIASEERLHKKASQ